MSPFLGSYGGILYKFVILVCILRQSYQLDYQVASLTLKSTISKTAVTPSSSIKKMIQNDHYIGHILQNGQIDLWFKANQSLATSMIANTGNLAGSSSPFIDCDLVSNDSNYIWIVTATQFIQVIIATQTMNMRTNIPNSQIGQKIEVTQTSLYILVVDIKFYRYQKGNYASFVEFDTQLVNINQGLRACEVNQPTTYQSTFTNVTVTSSDYDYLIIWNTRERITTHKCLKNSFDSSSCSFLFLNYDGNIEENYSNIHMNYDCSEMIYDLESAYPMKIMDVQEQNIDLSFDFTPTPITGTDQISDIWFLDYERTNFMTLLDNATLMVYDTTLGQSNALVKSFTLTAVYTHASYNIKEEIIYLANDLIISMYKFNCLAGAAIKGIGKCVTCNSACPLSCQNITGQCSGSNSSSQTNNSSNNQVVYASENQKAVVEGLSQGLQTVTEFTQYASFSLMILPFSALFLKFISFWTVCSFYAFVDIDMPQFLRNILTQIFVAINSSLFAVIGIDTMPSLYLASDQSNQKFSSTIVDTYSITSDFLKLNFENIAMLIFSMGILIILYLVSRIKCKQNNQQVVQNQLKQNSNEQKSQYLFQIDMFEMTVGQLLSIMPSVFLGLFLIKQQYKGQKVFTQKINLVLFIVFIGISLIYPFFVLAFGQKQSHQPKRKMQTKKDRVTKRNKKKQQVFQQKIRKLSTFYLLQCNILTPFTAILNIVSIFILINFVLFSLGIYVAWNQSHESKLKKINNILLSCWLFLVHLSMTGMAIFGQNQHYQINHYLALFCIGAILLGAFHQALNFIIVDIIYSFFSAVYTFCKKKQAKGRISNFNHNNKQSHNKEMIEVHNLQKQSIVSSDNLKCLKKHRNKSKKPRFQHRNNLPFLQQYKRQLENSTIDKDKFYESKTDTKMKNPFKLNMIKNKRVRFKKALANLNVSFNEKSKHFGNNQNNSQCSNTS